MLLCPWILQARILEWVDTHSPGDFPDPGIKPGCPLLQATSLPTEPPGKCYTLLEINCSNILFDQPPKVKEIKTKINKWDLVKLKSVYTAKETKHIL